MTEKEIIEAKIARLDLILLDIGNGAQYVKIVGIKRELEEELEKLK